MTPKDFVCPMCRYVKCRCANTVIRAEVSLRSDGTPPQSNLDLKVWLIVFCDGKTEQIFSTAEKARAFWIKEQLEHGEHYVMFADLDSEENPQYFAPGYDWYKEGEQQFDGK